MTVSHDISNISFSGIDFYTKINILQMHLLESVTFYNFHRF